MTPERWPDAFGLEVFDEIDSTQSEARRRALAGASGPVWIMAKRQTAGHGRRGRVWHSPTGNLMTSVLLRPDVAIADAPQISFVAALAVADVFDLYAPGRCLLKWPNDPLLDGRKAAGVLPDSAGRADGRLDWLIVGFGLNLSSSPQDVPYPTISLAEATGTPPDADIVITQLANAWARRFSDWQARGFGSIREAWLARAFGIGSDIKVQLDAGSFVARFEGLDDRGGLIARLPDGQMRHIAAGDIFPVAS